MSFRRIGKGVWRIGEQIFLRIKGANRTNHVVKVISKHAAAGNLQKAAQRLPLSKNAFVRMLQQALRSTNKRVLARPFASLHLSRHFFGDDHRQRTRFTGLIVKRQAPVDVFDRIRNLFSSHQRYSFWKQSDEVPQQLDGYDIGSLIAYGCNAAVYEIRKASDSHHFAASNDTRLSPQDRKEMYPLALKVMFNYDFDLPEQYLWRTMGTELLPIPNPEIVLRGQIAQFRPMRHSHPNIIKIHTAFIDSMPSNLPESSNFPEATPSPLFYGYQDPKTLFIVMKRYRMTLREYTLRIKRNYWTGRVMLGQLLEAIVFLSEHRIAHRDIKSDNVLLDFETDDDIPHVVLSDFGSAMSTGSWLLEYPDDGVDLGGNQALRAPEIRCARPGPQVSVNYEKADLWAIATLGYEIFTRENPFYRDLKSNNYLELDLPPLPRKLVDPIKKLLIDTLSVDPEKRPSVHVAANVVCMSLFRFGEDVRQFLEGCGVTMDININAINDTYSPSVKKLRDRLQEILSDVTALYAAETILARGIRPGIVSQSELQLRATFLSRLDRNIIWDAVKYFFA
uniref:non-specific serine/threonine protein kinase n=1 Tax=Steinernema glaseri TaxID=37863 RepID=A0A1I7YEA7_9BILA